MKYQKPAQGIMLQNDWGDAKTYHIECECTDPDHAVKMWIEVNGDTEVQDVEVSFYVETWTPFWDTKFNRFKAAWDILVKGVNRQEHHMILKKQAALNFAGAVTDTVKQLENKRG